MSTDYDPFKNLDPNHEVHERIRAATGLATIDETTIDLISELLHHNCFERISGLDTHPDGIRCADATIANHRRNIRTNDVPIYVGEPTSTSLYAIFEMDPSVLFVLPDAKSWESLAHNTLPRSYRRCDVQASSLCQKNQAELVIPIKRGDFICIYKCCRTCCDWFNLDADERRINEHYDFATGYPFEDRDHVWRKPEEWDDMYGPDPWC